MSRGDAGYGAAHGEATHRESRHDLHVVAALPKGEVGTFLETGGKEPRGLLIKLRKRSWLFFGARDPPRWALLT
jgi:hypothetical protein